VTVVVTRGGSPGVDVAPFEAAVDNLTLSEDMTHRSTGAGAGLTVIRQGDGLGSMSLAGIDLQLLVVGGATSVKRPTSCRRASVPPGARASGHR
jgi:hypothetical protein